MDSDDFLTAAGFALERQSGIRHGAYELAAIDEAGLSLADNDALADAIWESLLEERDEQYRVSAYWALGKHVRSSDVSRFVAALRCELSRSNVAVYQILIALQNYGEPAFDPRRLGTSVTDEVLNRADASAYLARVS